MSEKNTNIESLFYDAFSDESTTPSSDLWNGIEKELNEQSVDELYKKEFKDDEVKPAASLWFKIQTKLFLKQFLTFQATKVNVYYVGALAILTGLGIGLNNEELVDAKIEPLKTLNETINKEIPAVYKVEDIKQDKLSGNTETIEYVGVDELNVDSKAATLETKEKPDAELTLSSKKIENIAPVTSKTPENEVIEAEKNPVNKVTIDASEYFISGREQTCKGNECIYTFEGLTKDQNIEWKLPENAQLVYQKNNELKILWNEGGDAVLRARVFTGTYEFEKELKIFVDKPVNPFFRGETSVCQGTEQSPYSVQNDRDLGKQYVWEVKKNPFRIISNGYIKVDWQYAGIDTITLLDLNNITQCNSTLKIPVMVLKQPQGEILAEMVDMGEYQFEFSNHKRGNTYKWTVEGDTYTDIVPVHRFYRGGDQEVDLVVTDRNKCKSNFNVRVITRKHFLRLPRAFDPDEHTIGFKPVVSSELSSYRIEIFNARNERIWESTKLADGYPAEAWDGTFKGDILPEGKYVCRITATFEDGTEWHGFNNDGNTFEFTLIR